MSSNLRLVLDTNVFIVSMLPHHKYWWVYEGIMFQRFTLLVSNEILLEYLEKSAQKLGPRVSEEQIDFLLEFSNVELVTPYFNWNLITADADDNKFIDCAVSGQADFIVTHDKHFRILEEIPFPKISAIGLDTLEELLDTT